MSKTLQGKYADKLNKQIEELYKVIDAKDKIINEQVLEIERLNENINYKDAYENIKIAYDMLVDIRYKAIEYIKDNACYGIQEKCCLDDLNYNECDELLEILGDKENE